jgi:hypothetical protein
MIVTGIVVHQARGLGGDRQRLAHPAERTRAHDHGLRRVAGARQLLTERQAHRPRLRAARLGQR